MSLSTCVDWGAIKTSVALCETSTLMAYPATPIIVDTITVVHQSVAVIQC